MVHHLVVEDVLVGETGEEEVEDDDTGEGDGGEGEDLSRDVVAGPCGEEGRDRGRVWCGGIVERWVW